MYRLILIAPAPHCLIRLVKSVVKALKTSLDIKIQELISNIEPLCPWIIYLSAKSGNEICLKRLRPALCICHVATHTPMHRPSYHSTKTHRLTFNPRATSKYLNAPLPIQSLHRGLTLHRSSCAPQSFRVFQIKGNWQKTSQSCRPSPRLSPHAHMHTLPTQTLTKAFNPHNSTPPFFSVWAERGRATVAMVMHRLLRLICAGHLSGLTECVCVCEGERVREREQAVYFQTCWWLLCPLSAEMLPHTGSFVRHPKSLQYFNYDKLHI